MEFYVQEVLEYRVINSDGYTMGNFESQSEADAYKEECEQSENDDE